MNQAITLAFAVMVPFLLLGLLLWLARLEDTLVDGLEAPKATREPAPEASHSTVAV
jgi:hypothetical protein